MSHAVAIQTPEYCRTDAPAMPANFASLGIMARFVPASHTLTMDEHPHDGHGPLTEREAWRYSHPYGWNVSAIVPTVRWRRPQVEISLPDGGGTFSLLAPLADGYLKPKEQAEHLAEWSARLREIAKVAKPAAKPRKGAKPARATSKAMRGNGAAKIPTATLDSLFAKVTLSECDDTGIVTNGKFAFRVPNDVRNIAIRECEADVFAAGHPRHIKAESINAIFERAARNLGASSPLVCWHGRSEFGTATARLRRETPISEVVAHARLFDGSLTAQFGDDATAADATILRFDYRFACLAMLLFPDAQVFKTRLGERGSDEDTAIAFVDRDTSEVVGIIMDIKSKRGEG